MTDDAIDYDKLATMVAQKLTSWANASVQGQAALDDAWLGLEFHKWVAHDASHIASYVFKDYQFDQAFKTKLKYALNNFANGIY